MICDKEKISLRQAFIIFILLLGSPSVRVVPSYAANEANQAAWLSPIVSFGIVSLLILIFKSFFKKYKDESFIEIIENIFGKVLGTIISVIYIVWITILGSLYVRHFGERFVSTILTNFNILIFITVILVVCAYILRSGIVVLARMGEIFLPIVIIAFLFPNIFLIPEFDIKNLYPITYKDIVPIFKGSIVTTGVWIYITFIFIFSDKIKDKENIKKLGIGSILFLTFLSIIVIITPLGVFGAKFTSKLDLPTFSLMKQVSVLGVVERIESAIVGLWIFVDFTIIAVFSFAVLHMMKSMFKLPSIKPFINIYMVILFFFSLYISKSIFELQAFSKFIAIPMNIILGYGIPLIVFIVGKIRKKI